MTRPDGIIFCYTFKRIVSGSREKRVRLFFSKKSPKKFIHRYFSMNMIELQAKSTEKRCHEANKNNLFYIKYYEVISLSAVQKA